MYYGSAAHAEQVTFGRRPGVKDALQSLTFAHLPEQLQRFSRPFYGAACEIIETILTDSAELTTSLNELGKAEDSAVRAGIRHNTGRAGSVPRPQEVTEPPKLSADAAEILAEKFHETYERLAPDFGYRTREASAKPWTEVPEQNRKLM